MRPRPEQVAAAIEATGVAPLSARACALLGLGDADVARELACPHGVTLRAAAELYARSVLARAAVAQTPWIALLEAVKARGEAVRAELEQREVADLELYPRREHKRIKTEWAERGRRAKRRVETAELDLGLQLVTLWFADLAAIALGAEDLVRHVDRAELLAADAGPSPAALRAAMELVEDTRVRFALNVSEDLACEALAYRLERALAS